MTRAHKLMAGGLWLLMATGCGGDEVGEPWTLGDGRDLGAEDQRAGADLEVSDQAQVEDMAPDQAQVEDMSGPQCALEECVPVGCAGEIRCGQQEPGLMPCPPEEWGVFSHPGHRCECSGAACEAPRCVTSAECREDELCLQASPTGMSPMLGHCVQTSCGAIEALYDAIGQQDVVPCAQDADCEVYVPSYECCRGWAIPQALRYEAEKIDAYMLRTRCDVPRRMDCSVVDCAQPEAFCDAATNRCALR